MKPQLATLVIAVAIFGTLALFATNNENAAPYAKERFGPGVPSFGSVYFLHEEMSRSHYPTDHPANQKNFSQSHYPPDHPANRKS